MSSWFKVGRADRDKILASCGEKSPGVVAVWLAFCDVANRHRSGRFTASTAELGRVAGVGRRTVERTLPVLRSIGLIDWTRNVNASTGGLEANTYNLPSFDSANPPPDCRKATDTMSEPLPTASRHPTDKIATQTCRGNIDKTEKTTRKLTGGEMYHANDQLKSKRRQLQEMKDAGNLERSEHGFSERKLALEAEIKEIEGRLA